MKISVVIPTYNRVNMIGRALDSIYGQQNVDAPEIILVDDGSTDGTVEFVRHRYPLVQILEQVHGGASAARNRGIDKARGDYIVFLDSDDELTPDSLACRVQALEENPDVDVVCGNFAHCIDGDPAGSNDFVEKRVLERTRHRPGRAGLIRIDNFFDVHLVYPITITSGLCLRRAALRPDERFDERIFAVEDWEFCLRLSRTHLIGILMDIVVKRHVHGSNIAYDPAHCFAGNLTGDRAVLAYRCLSGRQRRYLRARLAEDLYDAAFDRCRRKAGRLRAMRYLLESLVRHPSLPKLKLGLALLLPEAMVQRYRRTRLRGLSR